MGPRLTAAVSGASAVVAAGRQLREQVSRPHAPIEKYSIKGVGGCGASSFLLLFFFFRSKSLTESPRPSPRHFYSDELPFPIWEFALEKNLLTRKSPARLRTVDGRCRFERIHAIKCPNHLVFACVKQCEVTYLRNKLLSQSTFEYVNDNVQREFHAELRSKEANDFQRFRYRRSFLPSIVTLYTCS